MIDNEREDARKLKLKYYFTGIPCKNGHIDKRYTNTGICYQCKRNQNNRDYKNHTQRYKVASKKYYNENIEKHIKNSLLWSRKNREKSREIKRRNRFKYKSKYLKNAKDYQKKKSLDLLWRLNRNMSKAIWSWLKGHDNFRKYENLISYTAEELRSHIEKQFYEDMSWENYGTYWSIDHVKPKSLCENFEETWELSNLQPLKVSENNIKNNTYTGKYKESYDKEMITLINKDR